jgi:ATP-dependent protease ClpP protease subunit
MQSEVIDLRGSIGESPNTVEEFTQTWRAKERLGKPIEIQIASVGGFVSDALAMHGLLSQSRVGTTARIEFALSAATIVSCAAKHVTMVSDGLFMVHSARLTLSGTAGELRKRADEVDRMDSMMAGIYARKTGKAESSMRTMMDAETWMTAPEAKSNGFVDDVLTDAFAKVSPMVARATFKTEIARIAARAAQRPFTATSHWDALIARFQSVEKLTRAQAVRLIASKFPEIHQGYLAEYNALHRAQR